MEGTRSEGKRHIAQAHTSLKSALNQSQHDLEASLDWAKAWPHTIPGLISDLESMINQVRVLRRAVDPPDYADGGHVRVLPAERPIIRIDDEDFG
jgi:hypothetical protein